MSKVLEYLPILIAPVALVVFTFITAYVRKFAIARSGLTQDYIVFAVMVIAALWFGGAI